MVILIRMCTVAPRIFISENSLEKYFLMLRIWLYLCSQPCQSFCTLRTIMCKVHVKQLILSIWNLVGTGRCKVKTHSQNFMLTRCENSLGEVDYPLVTPYWAELWLLLLALHQHLELTQVVLLTLEKSHLASLLPWEWLEHLIKMPASLPNS